MMIIKENMINIKESTYTFMGKQNSKILKHITSYIFSPKNLGLQGRRKLKNIGEGVTTSSVKLEILGLLNATSLLILRNI